MGDKVQTILEEMVPEVLHLQKMQLLTKAESKSVIKNRRNFEYALKRRELKKVDFLRYITYEINLEQLIAKRRKIRRVSKKSALDFARIKKIYSLFHRALHRFPGDLKLWKQFIGFAQLQGSNRTLSSIYAKALQFHMHNVSLWIEAAQWQFSANQSPAASRVLFQRALRLKGTESVELWIEYVRMEVTFWRLVMDKRQNLAIHSADEAKQKKDALAEKERQLLKTIQDLLSDLISTKKSSKTTSSSAPLIDISSDVALRAGEDVSESHVVAQEQKSEKKQKVSREADDEEYDDDNESADEEESDPGYSDEDDVGEDVDDAAKVERDTLRRLKLKPVTENQRTDALKSFLELTIVKTVARSALNTMASATGVSETQLVTLVRGILAVYADFEEVQDAQGDLLQSASKCSALSAAARIQLLASAPVLLALKETPVAQQLEAVAQSFDAAPVSAELLDAELRFYGEVLPRVVQDDPALLTKTMKAFLQRVANHRASLSPKGFERFVFYLLSVGAHQQALEQLGFATATQYPTNVGLRLLHARVLIQSGADAQLIANFFSSSFAKLMADSKYSLTSELVEYQHLYSEWYLTQPHAQLSEYLSFFKKSIKKDSQFHAEVLPQIAVRFGIEGARQALDAFTTACVPPTETFFLAYLDLELAQVPQDTKRIEKTYNRGVDMYGTTSPDFWIHHARYYVDSDKQDKALEVFWRARKTLRKTGRIAFIARYHQVAQGVPPGGGADDDA